MKTETDGNEKTETRRKKTEGWDILYPEDKERYPKYYVKRLKYIPDDMREVNKLLKKLNRALAGDRKKRTLTAAEKDCREECPAGHKKFRRNRNSAVWQKCTTAHQKNPTSSTSCST